MRDAQEYLSDRQFGKLAFECDASELHFINPCYDAFRVGQVIHWVSSRTFCCAISRSQK